MTPQPLDIAIPLDDSQAMSTKPHITEAMRASARAIGEAMLAHNRGTGTLDAVRAAMRASRELHGEDVHNAVKAIALQGAFGG